jgi:hypothetical protein
MDRKTEETMMDTRIAGLSIIGVTLYAAASIGCGGATGGPPPVAGDAAGAATNSNGEAGSPNGTMIDSGGGAQGATANSGTDGSPGGGGVSETVADAGGPIVIDGSIVTDATVLGAPTIDNNGFLTLDAGAYVLVGSVAFTAGGGSGSTINGSFGSNYFCASGSVVASPGDQSWATASFNVNAPKTATGSSPAHELFLSANSITLSFANYAGSPLMISLLDNSYDLWCYELTGVASPVTIPLSSFNSHCWDNSGASFMSGTAIQSIELSLSGSPTASTPFDFCLLGLTIQPSEGGAPDAGGGAAVVDGGSDEGD